AMSSWVTTSSRSSAPAPAVSRVAAAELAIQVLGLRHSRLALYWGGRTGPKGAMSLDQASKIVKQQTLTRDAFLGGRLIVSQPGNGFRAGMDSVLLGAAVSPKSNSLLDLGAGAGTASLVALAHNPA